jgi:hypothetical protein
MKAEREMMLGRYVEHHSPAAVGKVKVAEAMREVHRNVPKSVVKTGKTGKAKEKMLQAIAFSKARAR